MKVFIENESKSRVKNIFNEKTFEFIKTMPVSREYPFPYGFVLNTTAEDGDNVDAFVLTNKKLKSGQIVDCEPIGLMEQFEQSWDSKKLNVEEVDHNVLMIIKGEEKININAVYENLLSEFVKHVFDNIQLNKTRIGRFLGKEDAIKYISKHFDK